MFVLATSVGDIAFFAMFFGAIVLITGAIDGENGCLALGAAMIVLGVLIGIFLAQ